MPSNRAFTFHLAPSSADVEFIQVHTVSVGLTQPEIDVWERRAIDRAKRVGPHRYSFLFDVPFRPTITDHETLIVQRRTFDLDLIVAHFDPVDIYPPTLNN